MSLRAGRLTPEYGHSETEGSTCDSQPHQAEALRIVDRPRHVDCKHTVTSTRRPGLVNRARPIALALGMCLALVMAMPAARAADEPRDAAPGTDTQGET